VKKQSKFEKLMQDSGWVGIVVRLAVIFSAVALMQFLPQIFTWISTKFLSERIIIDENRHSLIMYLAYFILVMECLFECVNAARRLLKR